MERKAQGTAGRREEAALMASTLLSAGKFRQLTLLLVLLFATNLLTACFRKETEAKSGAAYKADLIRAIEQSDKIIVTEHSSEMDFIQAYPDSSASAQHTEIIYHKHALTAQEKEKFLTDALAMADETQDAFSACISDPHHSFSFYHAGKLTSKLDVCFQCAQVEWPQNRHAPPWAIYDMLAKTVNLLGMHDERDWVSLVRKKASAPKGK